MITPSPRIAGDATERERGRLPEGLWHRAHPERGVRRLLAASDDERRDVFLTTARRLGTARRHCSRARRLSVEQHPAKIDFLREYRRLAALFTVEVTTFERKRYTNLSHEPNKAMNLNSCISLTSRSFREVESPLHDSAWSREGCRRPDLHALLCLELKWIEGRVSTRHASAPTNCALM